MPLAAVVVDVEPKPLAIAARFAGRPGFAFLHAASGDGQPSFIAVDPIESSSAWLPPGCSEVGSRTLDKRTQVPRWIGAVPYDCARALERAAWTRTPDDRPPSHMAAPFWWRYGAVVEIDPRSGIVRVVGDDGRRVDALARELNVGAKVERSSKASLRLLEAGEPPEAHIQRIRRAACSPELFLTTAARGQVRTAPVKGTRPRGKSAVDDALLARELDESPKEKAELTMILDVERNDLGRVASSGSVRLLRGPIVETHRTVHHRLALLGARLDPRFTQLDLLRAMFPSGSVTGAPKVRAMEVIARLEPVRRGLYTGAFGSVALDGSLRFAMAIRVLTIRGHEGHYFAGGGIVADSDPEAEFEETRWKGAQLERLLESWPKHRS
jgi:hypothetical protein